MRLTGPPLATTNVGKDREVKTLSELESVRQSIKRWRSRAKLAQTKLDKLYRKETRLMSRQGFAELPPIAVPPPAPPAPAPVEKKDELDIPAAFIRKPQGTPEERRAMPLSDRDAMKFIKAQSAKVTAKRAKRDRPFMK